MEYLTVSEVEEIPFLPSTIETIDVGLYNWVNESLDIHTTTNSGFKKVPCLWLTAERSFQIKNNKDLRDSTGKLKLPIISVHRTSMLTKPENSKAEIILVDLTIKKLFMKQLKCPYQLM